MGFKSPTLLTGSLPQHWRVAFFVYSGAVPKRRAKNDAVEAARIAADASIQAARIQTQGTVRGARVAAISGLVGAIVAGSCGVAGTGVGTYLTTKAQGLPQSIQSVPTTMINAVMVEVTNTWDTATQKYVGLLAYRDPYTGGPGSIAAAYPEGHQVAARCLEPAGRIIIDTSYRDRPTSSTVWIQLSDDLWLPGGYVTATAALPIC